MNAKKTVLGIIAVLGLLCAGAHAQSFLTNNLVAYYPFNGNANDASGNGYNGTNINAVATTNQFGYTNSAYDFNGSAEVDLPLTTVTNFSSGTISAWVDLRDNTQATIFSRQHDGVDSYAVFSIGSSETSHGYESQGTPGTVYFRSDNEIPTCASSNMVPTEAWCQVAVVFSPTNCIIFINGTPSGVYYGNFSLPLDPATVDVAGSQDIDNVYSYNLNGIMDDLRIYDTALSSNEIAQLYAIESTPPHPVIVNDLTNVIAVSGSTYTLSGKASAPANFAYQWYYTNGTAQGLAGAYAETVSGFVYGAVITNGGFGYGNVPSVHFVGGGGSGAAGYGTASNGELVSITVTNAGSGYTSLPSVVIDPPNGLLFGQTNATLVLTDVNTNDIGDYWFVAANAAGSAMSQMASLTIVYPPTIATNPVAVTGVYHGSDSLSVSAGGTPPFTYQWSLNGTNLGGATNSTYVINSLTLTNTGSYAVQVSNAYGTTNSSPANVYLSPALTSPFTGTVALWGQDTLLQVGAIGSGSLGYQWYFNGAAISGATGSNLDFSMIQFTNAGLYSVVVSSAYGSVTNAAYQVAVNPANTTLGLYPGITITGTIGYTYQVQSSTNLGNASGWITETNLTLTQPVEIWYDANANTTLPGNPHKFYQVVPGQ